jgi:uncharacterized glyoxalase superfamily protein PhnB
MLENRSVPPDTILPHVEYQDLAAAIAWLTKTFGFIEHYRYGDPVSGAQLHIGNAWIMVNQADPGTSSPAKLGYGTQSLTVFVDDVDERFQRTKAAGGKIVEALHVTEYGERQYGVEDLEGHHWLFSRHARDVSPDEWGAMIAQPSFRQEAAKTWESSDRTLRLAGLCGLAGALLFFLGDMLFYGYFGSGASFADGMIATVMRASQERLFAGGLVGPLAACLCIVGFWHVYLNIRPSQVPLGRMVFILFSALMVAGSAVHTLWTARGLALKDCYGQGAPCSDLLTAIKSYWALAYNLGAIPGYFGAVLLFGLVLLRKTYYPRWTVIANPAVLMVLSPLADRVPAPLGAMLVGGFTNLSIAAFFLVSVLTTWNRRQDA